MKKTDAVSIITIPVDAIHELAEAGLCTCDDCRDAYLAAFELAAGDVLDSLGINTVAVHARDYPGGIEHSDYDAWHGDLVEALAADGVPVKLPDAASLRQMIVDTLADDVRAGRVPLHVRRAD